MQDLYYSWAQYSWCTCTYMLANICRCIVFHLTTQEPPILFSIYVPYWNWTFVFLYQCMCSASFQNHSHSHQTGSLYKHIESSLETWLHCTHYTQVHLYVVSLRRIGPIHTQLYSACTMTHVMLLPTGQVLPLLIYFILLPRPHLYTCTTY